MKKIQSRRFTFKQRAGSLLGILFIFTPLTIASVWFGLDSLNSDLSFPPSLIYSWGTWLLLFAPLLFIPLIIMVFPPIFTGKEMTMEYAMPLLKIMIWGCAFAVLADVVYGFYYTNQLEKRGYVPCKGIPTGYMPGMGKQYVTNMRLCK